MTATDSTTDAQGSGRYVEVNGISLWVATHGSGSPLVLLHGGLMSGETFGLVLPALSERHRVIVVDLQGRPPTTTSASRRSSRP